MIEKINTFGEQAQLENKPKNLALQLSIEEIDGFQKTAREYALKADSIISDCYLGYLNKSEPLLAELFSLFYNSKSFDDYCKDIKKSKAPDEEGFILLASRELSGITTYLLAMLKSRETLIGLGVDISFQ